MQMLIHPPWRTMAEEILKVKDPELYREFSPTELRDHLDEQAERAREAYEHLVKRIVKDNPGKESWAIQAAQEIVVRDVLDPSS